MEDLILVPCLICKNQLRNPNNIFKARTQFTRTLFGVKLSRIVHRKLESGSVHQENICSTCQSLLNLIDEHESKLLAYENEVRLKFKLPFPIVLEDKNDVVPPQLDDQPISEPDIGVPTNGDLEPGPDDVIVSADDSGLVTVTYGQAGNTEADCRPPGSTSPAVLWDGDSDQQIIIFPEQDMAPVVDMLEDLVHGAAPIPPVANAVGFADPGPIPETASHPGKAPVGPRRGLGKSSSRPSRQSLAEPGAVLSGTIERPVPLPASYFCDTCDASFSTTDGLAEHRVSHVRLRYRCGFCPERCATPVALSRHMNAAHADSLLPCLHCNKRFVDQKGLKQHYKQHNTRQFPCPICDRRFVSQHDLTLHTTYKHSDSRPFSCDICRKTFKTQSAMRRHKMKHTGLKPHVCSYCGMSFAHKFSMENHMTTHVARRHVCPVCGRKFGRLSSVEHHIRIMHSADAFASS